MCNPILDFQGLGGCQVSLSYNLMHIVVVFCLQEAVPIQLANSEQNPQHGWDCKSLAFYQLGRAKRE